MEIPDEKSELYENSMLWICIQSLLNPKETSLILNQVQFSTQIMNKNKTK